MISPLIDPFLGELHEKAVVGMKGRFFQKFYRVQNRDLKQSQF